MTTGKTIALTRRTLVGKVMSLLLNMLSRLVITFLPRRKYLLISPSYLKENLAFELWCWRRLLRVPWTARRSNLSILKEISPGCSLEGLMSRLRLQYFGQLKLQYFGHLMRRVDSLEKTLMVGGIGGRRRRGWQKMRWLDGITDLMDVRVESNSL